MIIQTISSDGSSVGGIVTVLRVTTAHVFAGDAVRLAIRTTDRVVVFQIGLEATPRYAKSGTRRIGWGVDATNDFESVWGVHESGKMKFSDSDLRKIGLSGQMLASQMYKDGIEAIEKMEHRKLKRGESQYVWTIDQVIEGKKRKTAAERAMARAAARVRYQ